MSDDLEKLIERVRRIEMSPEAEREQRRSFVYGNVHIENARITRDLVTEVDQQISAAEGANPDHNK